MDAPSSARLGAVVANVPGAVYRCRCDLEWTMLVISDEIERITGHPASDFVGGAVRTFGSVVHPEDRPGIHAAIAVAVEHDAPFAVEYRILRADGTTAWVLEHGRLTVDPDIPEPVLDGIIFDVTARRAAAEAERLAGMRATQQRIIDAADRARRAIERDLHDGAQTRLVALALRLRAVRIKLEQDPPTAAELLEGAIAELGEATTELRELARGIHPAVLTDRGLAAALHGLAARFALPVIVEAAPAGRLPAAVESAAYFVVCEGLTNVARHAGEARATVRVEAVDGHLHVVVADDGPGGPTHAEGTGLRGLTDRLDALGGTVAVERHAGAGTRLSAIIPWADPADRARHDGSMVFVRYVLPAALIVAGFVLLFAFRGSIGVEGWAMCVGAGLSVLLMNVLFRAGATGDEERRREDEAREYFARHGRWPDER